MNAIKPLATIAVLAAMGVFLFLYTNSAPESEPPPEAAGTWGTPPAVELPAVGGELAEGMVEFDPSSSTLENPSAASSAPSFAPPFGDSAPAFGGSASPDAAGGATGGVAPADTTASALDATESPAEDVDIDAAIADAAASTGAPLGSDQVAGTPDAAASNDSSSGHSPSGEQLSSYEAAKESANQHLSSGKLAEALKILSSWYGDPSLSPLQEHELMSLLSGLAGTVVYSREHHLEPPYIVREGDTLETIAHEYQVPWQLLANINSLTQPEEVQPGQEIKVLRGPFTAMIHLEKQEMALMVDGHYAGRFDVGVGQDRPQMKGDWVVKHKLTNPTYYGHAGQVAADDPQNPLGEYWIGLASAEPTADVAPLGIHGSAESQQVQGDDPRGYIRLAPRDAQDVYHILSDDSKVTVLR
ncbi:MAG: LysM peptidoglycan-binding domain-containing protein [Pirellulales bacterium]